ncbi:radical SAM family heme chaperone HemW [Leadbetterella sp. DM7]|uniref:radical SAM family heme chaperone HemW n=1 Tax=Leadbetterella sp. DM7 TaxID=3235085 RepID=UPI00349EEBE5
MHLYLHIPFCKQACHYCDFHFSTNLSYKQRMVEAIAKEIALKSDYLGEKKLETLYFGGGSPSILTNSELEKLFKAVSDVYTVDNLKEVTLEANPDDITQERLDFWYSLGINRISLGIQTFNEVFLKFMNRAHTSGEALKALELILNKGFETSSADLIYAKTGFHLDEKRQAEILRKDLEILSGFDLQHISAYNLTIEEDTVFGRWAAKEKLAAVSDDYAADQYRIVIEELGQLGFEQYEISNFARNKAYAVHNTSYWSGDEYLGVGPSAHSYDGDSRQWNVAHNHRYMQGIESGRPELERELLSPSEKVNDYLLTGLRTIWGVSLHKIFRIWPDIPATFRDSLEKLKSQQLIVQEGDAITIPAEARILSDRVAAELFVV